MSQEERKEAMQEQHERQMHQGNLSSPQDGSNAPETLKYISKPEDIDSPIDALDWINSKSTSTANLDPDDVTSKEWVLEYHQLLAKLNHPPEYGVKGHRRAWMYDDRSEYRTPLDRQEQLEVEGFTEIGKEASTRSKDGWGTETATRDTKESIVRDENEDSGSSGILGRLRG